MKHLRALDIKYYGPPNYKGARVRVRDLRGIIERPLWIPYDHAYNGASDVAEAYPREQGWTFERECETPDGHLLLTSTFRRETWKP